RPARGAVLDRGADARARRVARPAVPAGVDRRGDRGPSRRPGGALRGRAPLDLPRRTAVDGRRAGVRRMRIDVGGIELFFDVEGAKVVASEEAWIERPTVVLLHA